MKLPPAAPPVGVAVGGGSPVGVGVLVPAGVVGIGVFVPVGLVGVIVLVGTLLVGLAPCGGIR